MGRERKALVEILARKISPGSETASAGAAGMEEAGRLLKRLGLAPRRARAREIEAALGEIAAELSEEVGKPVQPAEVAELLGAYAAEEAHCAEAPRCRGCELAECCKRYNKRPTLKELPEDDRPRERLLKRGSDALSDAELLAIIIRDGTQEASAVGLAQALLARFGSLRELSRAGVAEITCVKGIGPAKAAQIMAALAVGRRAATEPARSGDVFDSPERVFAHFRALLRDVKQETFHVVLLDAKHRLIRSRQVFVGTLNQSTVHPREIFNEAIRESAAAVIFVHNHPSGDPTPSREDVAITRRLKEAGELVGIKALDHVIIGGDAFTSMAALGVL